MTRTDNSIRNLRYALVFQTLALLTAFVTRRVFVSVLTQDYLGLDGTFANILVALSLAELGLGDAMLFSLYKPMAEGDTEKLRSLMRLFRNAYRVIGSLIALLGIAVAPLLRYIIRDLPDVPHLYLIYFLFVANSSLSYFFVYKQSIILADQKRYHITVRRYGLWTVLYIAQAIFLLVTRSYIVYLVLQLAETLVENLILARKADRLYPFLKGRGKPQPPDSETRSTVTRNTKAMFLHKLGGAMVFNTDNLLISYFIGVASVGIYSNYLLVIRGIRNLYKMVYAAFTGSVGNLGATEGSEAALRVYRRMSFAGNWMIGFCSICLAVLFEPFLTLWVGESYLFPTDVMLLIVLNFYVTGMREVNQTFHNAYGLFRHLRYKSVFESVINLVVSIVLAKPLGAAGIFIGTFASTMLTCFWVEPYVLFKHVFRRKLRTYFMQYAAGTLVTAAAGIAAWATASLIPGTGVLALMGKAAICAVLPNIVFAVFYCRTDEFRFFAELLRSRLYNIKKPKSN